MRVVLGFESACRIRGHQRGGRNVRQEATVWPTELEGAAGVAIDLVTLLMDRAVVPATEQREVRERRRATVSPSGARDDPRRGAARIPGSGSRGLDDAARAVSREESSASARRSPRRARLHRAASLRGWRRTPGADTFPRKRVRRPRARTGRVDPSRRGRARRRAPLCNDSSDQTTPRFRSCLRASTAGDFRRGMISLKALPVAHRQVCKKRRGRIPIDSKTSTDARSKKLSSGKVQTDASCPHRAPA